MTQSSAYHQVKLTLQTSNEKDKISVSAVGWAPGVEGLYVIVTHSGVTLGPALAEMASREIDGVTEKMLASFRPDRFQA